MALTATQYDNKKWTAATYAALSFTAWGYDALEVSGMIYDSNWSSYAMYVTCTVESSCNYGCVETYAMAGIGIAQWTYDRSWQLLNKLVTDYPSIDWATEMPILYPQVAPGTSSWGEKIFSQYEANEVTKALTTDEGVATQNALWEIDCQDSYIPLLRDRCNITDPKTAVFALTVYHQAPNAFWQIYNAVGDCDVNTWYTATMNNGIVGRYTNRQNTVKDLLDAWDGSSPAEGFGVRDEQVSTGGNNNPNYGNPDDTYTEISVTFGINRLIKKGSTFVLMLKDAEGHQVPITFIKAGSGNIWYPSKGGISNDVQSPTVETPNTPTISGTNDDIEWIVNKMNELKGTLYYSQGASERTNIPGGSCDCSGLVWWLYNQRGYNVGTWTGSQKYDGELIEEGGGGSTPNEANMQLADFVLLDWSSDQFESTGHIELYMGNDTICGHGGNPYYGPVDKSLSNRCSIAHSWQIRRIITI